MALIKKNSEVPSNALIFAAELYKHNLQKLHAKNVFHSCKAFDLYIMAPLFALYSATFFWHEIDCEQSLFFFRFDEESTRVRERQDVPASPISHLHPRAWS